MREPPSSCPLPTLHAWLAAVDWAATDTAWVLVAEAPVLSTCSLPKLSLLLEQANGRPTATLLGGIRATELTYWAERQFPGGHKLGVLLADPLAWDSLNLTAQLIVYTFPRPEKGLDKSFGPSEVRWGMVDSVRLDERQGPFSPFTMISVHPEGSVLALDPQYRRLRQIDPHTGGTLRDLDLDIPYESFYHRFVWPDTSGQSLLGWLDSDSFQARSFTLAEGFRAAWSGHFLTLSFTRRYPKLVQDTTGRWVTTLQSQGFILQLDTAWQILRQGLCHETNLPPGMEYGGQSLLPLGPDSGLVSLHDFRKGIAHRNNIGYYRFVEDRKIAVQSLLPLAIPAFLQVESHGTRFAEPFLAGHARQWVAGFRLHPTARIYPANQPLQFPDTITALSNRLVSTIDRIAERRIAWMIAGEAWDHQGRLWLAERRDSLPDRLLGFANNGTCLLTLPLPASFEGQPIFLQDGVLWAWKRHEDELWLHRATFSVL